MSISLAKHAGLLEIDLDIPARGFMVPARLRVTRAGIEIRPKGRRLMASAPWWKVLRALALPPSAPAKFCSDVEGFLAERLAGHPLENRKRRTP
jgi:hypothetical protein